MGVSDILSGLQFVRTKPDVRKHRFPALCHELDLVMGGCRGGGLTFPSVPCIFRFSNLGRLNRHQADHRDDCDAFDRISESDAVPGFADR